MNDTRIAHLLDDLREGRRASGSPNTATMTLVAFVDDATVATWARERMRALAEKHPSRVILWDATQASDVGRIDATLAHSEWIDLGARDSTPDEIAAAVHALALAEAPLVVLWGAQASTKDERFAVLASGAQVAICDTSLAADDSAALRDLAEVCTREQRLTVADLAYLRLAPWQECVASFFDDVGVSDHLQQVDRVDISGSGAEAHYVLGWLGSRLGWSSSGINMLASRGRPVRFSIERRSDPRRIRRISIACGDARYHVEIDAADPSTIVFESSDARQGRRCHALRGTDVASLVEQAILLHNDDPVFQASLALASTLRIGAPE